MVASEMKQPSGCAEAEVAAFCALVRQGGEVDAGGLEARVRRAHTLAFTRVDGVLVGVAALKHPAATYRDGAFCGARCSDQASMFALELGWVFVSPEHRGRGYSRVVGECALSQGHGAQTFATTRADNVPMHKTLAHLGFTRLGDSWKSKRGDCDLVLYITPR